MMQGRRIFERLYARHAQATIVHNDWQAPGAFSFEVRALKTQKQDSKRIVFQFSERMDVRRGSVLQIKGAQDLWRVVDTEDRIMGGEYVCYEAYVEKMDEQGNAISPSASGHAVFNAPIYGPVQVGGHQNTQHSGQASPPQAAPTPYDTIFLEPEQKELLSLLVAAYGGVPRKERRDFVFHMAHVHKGAMSRAKMHETIDGGSSIRFEGRVITKKEDIPKELDQDFITHPGLDNGGLDTHLNDVDALKIQNFIHFRDETRFFITPQGFGYLERMTPALTQQVQPQQVQAQPAPRVLEETPMTTPRLVVEGTAQSSERQEAIPIDVFFSYSHKDETLRDKLANHLQVLERDKLITGWHDRKIIAGGEFAEQIDEHLNRAHIILLLVSAHFHASHYCYGIEMTRAVERHSVGQARVIPIILRDCDWHRAPFGALTALPTDGKAVTGRGWKNADEAFTNIAKGVRAAVEEMRQRPLTFRSGVETLDVPTLRATGAPRLRHYEYVSSTKVNMYFDEMLGLSPELLTGMGIDIQKLDDTSSSQRKLPPVEKYLCATESVGSVEHPQAWIEGTVDAHTVEIGDTIFYLAQTPTSVLALGGSAHHRIGKAGKRIKDSSSYTTYLLEQLRRFEEGNPTLYSNMSEEDLGELISAGVSQGFEAWIDIIANACGNVRGQTQPIRFLARKLQSGVGGELSQNDGANRRRLVGEEVKGKLVILATPLYVALDD